MADNVVWFHVLRGAWHFFPSFKNKTLLLAFLYDKMLSNSKLISFLKFLCVVLFVLTPLCCCTDDRELRALNNTIFECRRAAKIRFQKEKATLVLFKKKHWALHSPKAATFYRSTVPKTSPFVETPFFHTRICRCLYTLARITYSILFVAIFLCFVLQEH